MNLRILSWNVHGLPFPVTRRRRARMRRIAAQIVAEKPDFVLLQEVWVGARGPLLRSLPRHAPAFAATSLGNPAGGLLVLVRGRDWNIDRRSLRFRRFTRFAPRSRLREGDGLAGKGALLVRVSHRATGSALWLVDTHLQARYRADAYQEIRLAQIRELQGWIAELGSDAPVVIAGDFNTPATEALVYEELAALGTDATAVARATGHGITTLASHPSAAWIDYLLLRTGGREMRAKLRLIENESVDHPFCDHSALVADLEIDAASPR